MLKSNKILRYSFILLSLVLFAFIVIKAYDEYLFQINNRTLKQITNTSSPYKILPDKAVNQDEEVEKIISDFVTDNKYDISYVKPKALEEGKISPKQSNEEQDKNILSQEENIIDIKPDIEQKKDNLLQLGAYSNKENISMHVKKITLTFPILIKDKKFFVKNTTPSLYKLYIGPFEEASEAIEFCSTLRKNGVSCFFIQL